MWLMSIAYYMLWYAVIPKVLAKLPMWKAPLCAQVQVAEKQCTRAQKAVQELEQAEAASLELQAQLLEAQQALHSQQQFVAALQAASHETVPGQCFVTL